MKFVYIFFVLLLLIFIRDAIKAALAKEWLSVLSLLLLFPFLFFFVTSSILGGSAFHNAATDYEMYEAGHYYLVSHGTYTEVTYSQFKFMEVVEIIGISSFAIAFVLVVIIHAKNAYSK